MTPNYDKKIRELLDNIDLTLPRDCVLCKKEFCFNNNDLEAFRKHQVPPPKRCPECRRLLRLAFVNYTTFFKRQCQAPGHNENIISIIPQESKFKVWDYESYWSEKRNPFNYGQNYDKRKSFFNQLKEIYFDSPKSALNRDPANIDSPYVSYGSELKNCYYLFGGMKTENVSYGMWGLNTRDSMDIIIALNSEECYEVVFPDRCSRCFFCYFSKECLDSYFLYDCRGCSNCFGCVNLRNRKFCFFNEQLTEKEYFEKINQINLGRRSVLRQYKEKFFNFIKKHPIKAIRNTLDIDCSGNYLLHSNNCQNTFWAINSEHIINGDFIMNARDSYDVTIAANCEKLYSTTTVDRESFRTKFSYFSKGVSDCEYVLDCKNVKYCFGCVGLENEEYCILNKKYTPEEYWDLLDTIKCDMLSNEDYGDFFDLNFSPYPYNVTFSGNLYPKKEEFIKENGGYIDYGLSLLPQDIECIEQSNIPDDIKDIDDSILKKFLVDINSNKPYRIVAQELSFYKKYNIAIPELSPYSRLRSRLEILNNFKVYDETCFKCGGKIISGCTKEDGYMPYCEDCYKKEVY